jgi:hypothetical protein
MQVIYLCQEIKVSYCKNRWDMQLLIEKAETFYFSRSCSDSLKETYTACANKQKNDRRAAQPQNFMRHLTLGM